MISPLHPLSSKSTLTTSEWLELLDYEGLVGVRKDAPDLSALTPLIADGRVQLLPTITLGSEWLHVLRTEVDR